MKPTIYHIPVCPFSQRLEILLALKNCSELVSFSVVDITQPRDPALLALTRGTILAHPAARQVCREEIVKLYYDYALGAGNGALPAGRQRSSFSLTPHWRERPWPPSDKYTTCASDAELGL